MTAPRHELPAEDPTLAPRVAAAAAVRRLSHALVGHHADVETLERTARVANELAGVLGAGERRSRPMSGMLERFVAPEVPDGARLESNADRPYSGEASPLSLEPVIHRRGDEVEAVVVLDSAHEGAPERSHGGVVAAMFDDLFGFVLQIKRVFAFTGELAVRYSAATPLFVPVVFRARLEREEGRKLFMTAELHHGDELIATSTATMISWVPPGAEEAAGG